MTDAVLLHTDGPVWRLTLNAPTSRNALSLDMVEGLHAAFDRVEAEKPRGLVITGAGPVFCAGLDLAGIEGRSDADMLWLLTRIELMLQRLWTLPCRTLGLAQKAAIGAGADILVCCQHRILSDGGRMAFPGLGFGIFLGTHRLSLRIGENAAENLLSAGGPVAAEDALKLGLVHATPVAPEEMLEEWSAGVLNLDPHVAAHLSTTVCRADPDADMAAFVASAARPGLRDRIAGYVAAQKAARQKTDPSTDTSKRKVPS
ncbi:enoyl-CoA hydratase/isomerase family protein [Roseovarius sp. MMSF_3281]|uniref:enoyl-CoA hydratase/isomerase family protein n=1 Tax=Roseovarius sp. MMSF_3281 TaxID=3046694 RepID=UPI00273E16FE|nr:enoyl-CoA hydratase/isomerase family protein [Roseovarius sp. MMSF_3281]